jgi:hypothetical protein
METKIQSASVKVMRSHDYCHFEVSLSSSEATTPAHVDELRKEAARLADKAVAQYRIMKRNANKLVQETQERGYLSRRIEATREKAEGDRTVREQAELKAYEDQVWRASRRYNYDDVWDDDDNDY